MKNNILKSLTNNLGFKILAVIFAFTLWLVVYNIEDPTKTKTFSSNVTVENAEAVTDMDKCYEVVDGSNYVSFSVTAKRSVLDKLEDSDFTAVADMTNLVIGEDGKSATVRIDISASNKYASSVKFNGSTKFMNLTLEDLQSKQFVVSAGTVGTVAEGYALGSVSISNPNVLKVSGPESIVSQIDSVVATIDVDGMSMNLTDNVVPVLFDAEGNEIDTTKLKLSNTTVTIVAEILNTKQVDLEFETSGTLGEGATIESITSDPESVVIKGTASALNSVANISVPASVIDVTNAVDNINMTIDITEYLPEGVSLVDSAQASVDVVVEISAVSTRKIELSTSNITMSGLDSGYTAKFNGDKVDVSVTGERNAVEGIEASQLTGKVDLSGLSEGTYNIPVEISLDKANFNYDTVNVSVVIQKNETTTGESSETTNYGSAGASESAINSGTSGTVDSTNSSETKEEDNTSSESSEQKTQ